ncbi:hypothetical protein [Streptomyces sp. NPDC056405]|uniref:hypothetical protein n=1 Tax=Streptomyces sp. NPDC056405 TaxID=3345811 RepID=UPI0035DEF066
MCVVPVDQGAARAEPRGDAVRGPALRGPRPARTTVVGTLVRAAPGTRQGA